MKIKFKNFCNKRKDLKKIVQKVESFCKVSLVLF